MSDTPITPENCADRLRPHPATKGSVLVTAELARFCADQIAAQAAEIAKLNKQLADEDRSHEQTMTERDAAEEAADSLAHAISVHLDIEIGEHSVSMPGGVVNSPWQSALEHLNATPSIAKIREDAAALAIPASWKLVPVELTDERLEAGYWNDERSSGTQAEAYCDCINAAPPAPFLQDAATIRREALEQALAVTRSNNTGHGCFHGIRALIDQPAESKEAPRAATDSDWRKGGEAIGAALEGGRIND